MSDEFFKRFLEGLIALHAIVIAVILYFRWPQDTGDWFRIALIAVLAVSYTVYRLTEFRESKHPR